MTDMLLLARAYDFAARMHAGQTRKGEAAEPYINHPCEVADLLARACGGADAVLIAGGVLHDTVEDTDATRDDLAGLFGDEIATLVMEVSDDKSLPKAERKRLQIQHAPHVSAHAKMLKIADKTSNLRPLPPVRLPTGPPPDAETISTGAMLSWPDAVVITHGWKGYSTRPWLRHDRR